MCSEYSVLHLYQFIQAYSLDHYSILPPVDLPVEWLFRLLGKEKQWEIDEHYTHKKRAQRKVVSITSVPNNWMVKGL